jgi:hypothetical protein
MPLAEDADSPVDVGARTAHARLAQLASSDLMRSNDGDGDATLVTSSSSDPPPPDDDDRRALAS